MVLQANNNQLKKKTTIIMNITKCRTSTNQYTHNESEGVTFTLGTSTPQKREGAGAFAMSPVSNVAEAVEGRTVELLEVANSSPVVEEEETDTVAGEEALDAVAIVAFETRFGSLSNTEFSELRRVLSCSNNSAAFPVAG